MDDSGLRSKLEAEILVGLWRDLKSHGEERDAIIIVSQDLDLIDAGVKIAGDDVKLVSRWIESSRLTRPSLEQMKSWPPDKSFRFLIVQPYVLIQEIGH